MLEFQISVGQISFEGWENHSMKIKNIVVITLVSTVLSVGLLDRAAFSKEIEWQSYTDGMARGKFEKKKVFLHFYAEWCAACKTMANITFKDPGVKMEKDFFFLKFSARHPVGIRLPFNSFRKCSVV